MDPSTSTESPRKKSPPLHHRLPPHKEEGKGIDDAWRNVEDDIDGILLGKDIERKDAFELEVLLDRERGIPGPGPAVDSRQFDERDYRSHRRESFPHQSRHHHGSVRRKMSSSTNKPDQHGEIPPQESEQGIAIVSPPETSTGSPVTSDDQFAGLSESPGKKVQFEIGEGNASHEETSPAHQYEKKKHRKHHHHGRRDDSRSRKSSVEGQRRPSLIPSEVDVVDEEEEDIDDLDLETLSSHRFSDNIGFRRHRFWPKCPLEEQASTLHKVIKYDHQPHEIFVELDVLCGHGEHREWKEKARWIKYEEDVLEGSDRWGRPHVASLSFHSLINLRRLIETGVILLDLEERDLPGVAYRVVDELVRNDLISTEDQVTVMRALLLKHKHVNENEWIWRFNLRRNTTAGSLTSLHATAEQQDKHRHSIKGMLGSPNTVPEGLNGAGSPVLKKMTRRNSAASRLFGGDPRQQDVERIVGDEPPAFTPVSSQLSDSGLSEEDLARFSHKENILRRIPAGAEASIVLVGKDDTLTRPVLVFVRLAESSFMPNVTEIPIPVRFIFVLLGPSSFDLDYKEIGRSISTLMSNTPFHDIAYKADDRRDILRGIHDFLDESLVLPPGDWDSELFPFEEMKEHRELLRKRKEKEKRKQSVAQQAVDEIDGNLLIERQRKKSLAFQRSRKLFGGMMRDIKKRYRHYLSDFLDGFNFQTLASIIFIYFACVSGAIAFGGILSDTTKGHIGISETLISTSVSGLIFSLLSGQPLIILGTTGPLLLFDQSLFKVCEQNGIDYLGFRFWIGIWVAFIGMIVVMLDGSVIAKYFTRYVQEIFSGLISLIFISDAINNIVKVYHAHPLQHNYDQCENCTSGSEPTSPRPNTALLSTLLTFGTFAVAYLLRAARISTFFTPTIRKLLGNFAVPIAIAVMVIIDYVLREFIHTEKLSVPDGLSTTNDRISWWVNPVDQVELIILAVVPAGLLFILIFMETCICALLIGKNKLKKGNGFHLDIFLICFINAGMGSIGGSWVCAATVRALTHASSLLVFSTNNPPGEKPSVIGVKEQRVSNLVISLLLGFSVLMSPVLVLIPMAVLFGVFLYMGITSMDGVQLFQRCSLFFKQVSNHPEVPYVSRVKTSKMYLYTVIQLSCLIALFTLKYTPASLSIPFMLILLVPLRFQILPKIFKASELIALDGTGEEAEDADDDRKSSTTSFENFPDTKIHQNGYSNGFIEPEKTALINIEPEAPNGSVIIPEETLTDHKDSDELV